MSRSNQNATSSTIMVDYRRVDGWHVFTSDEVPGLYVADEDCKTAYDAVAPSIELLLRENQHINVHVKPRLPFERFWDYMLVVLARWMHGAAKLSKRVETATIS
ncbi:MAG: hypothetical protein IKE60_34575 [Reyranella sp.]|uniref:hypothetical protein n=1 Tax=Reyranella sp. TaxID=1929291 RepID=UPI0025E7C4BC|nr:hypothetical protein [Reyranella sp.]MBR2819847.1 hypothetical protein [Reyranella sp.]